MFNFRNLPEFFRQIAFLSCMSSAFPEMAEVRAKISIFGIFHQKPTYYRSIPIGALMLMQSKCVESSDIKLGRPKQNVPFTKPPNIKQ